MTAKFEENFWGKENRGFDVLYGNLKAGLIASKELADFLKERVIVEDQYVKGMSKLHKTISHVSEATLGGFSPLWLVLKDMVEQVSTMHSQFVQLLSDLGREVLEYNSSQKDKLKSSVKGEIEAAQESLHTFSQTDTQLQRTKKQYQQSCDHMAKIKGKLENSNPKTKQQLEQRTKQAEAWMDTMKGDHKTSVQNHCEQLMEFQGKMSEAAMKFESLEEEHMAQMVTFMIKLTQAHDTNHSRVGRVLQGINEQLGGLSVERLLTELVINKGTGTDKPTPYKFKPIQLVPPTSTLSVSSSTDDIRSLSPTGGGGGGGGGRTSSKGEKSFRSRFKRIVKGSTKAAAASEAAADQQPSPQDTNAPEVDAEGYSIRPQDAINISGFPDDPRQRSKPDSDSDSYSDDEPDRKLRHLKIREKSQAAASVDDIKASVMSLRLGAVSPSSSMRHATSSQSLNILDTPPAEHRLHAGAGSSNNIAEESSGVSSLLDIEIHVPSDIPTPLVPSANSNTLISISDDPTATLKPMSMGLPPPPSKRTDPSHPGSSARPVPRPRTSSKPLSTLTPTTNNDQRSSQIRKASDPSVSSGLLPPLPTKRRSMSPTTESATFQQNSTSRVAAPRLPNAAMMGVHAATMPETATTPPPTGTKSLNSSPILAAKTDHSRRSVTPPVPAPRSASLRRQTSVTEAGTNPVSPLITTSMSARAASTSPVGFTSSRDASGLRSSISSSSSSFGGVSFSGPVATVVPIAIAVQETCNAIFKGADVADCVVKVSGEVMMSFPASFLGQLSSHDPLVFKLANVESVERVLHNQNLLSRDEDQMYKFNMQELCVYLKQMQEKQNAPFYNVQLVKYEVKVKDGGALPLKLVSFWKCVPDTTNFRLDYSYNWSALTHGSLPPPVLSNVTMAVPVSGGVSNALSKPTGIWSADHSNMCWKLGDLQPHNDATESLQAKFVVASGPSVPSAVVASFSCDGCTLSGLDVLLASNAYRVSLCKRKIVAGKYMAEISK